MDFFKNLWSFFRNLLKKKKPEKDSVLEEQERLISEGSQEDEESKDTYFEVAVEEEQIGADMKDVPGFQPMKRTTTTTREYDKKNGKLLKTTIATVTAGNVAPSEPSKEGREQAGQNSEKQSQNNEKQSPIVEAIRKNARSFSQEIYENDRDGKSNDKFQGEKPVSQAKEMMRGLRNSGSENALAAKAVVAHLIGNLICVNKDAKEIFGADPDFAKFATDALENAQTQGQKINLMHGLNAFASCAKEGNELTADQRKMMGEKALEMAKDPQKMNEDQKATVAMALLNGNFEPTKEAMAIVQAFADSIQGEGKFQKQSNTALGKTMDRMRAKQETQTQKNQREEEIYEVPDPEQPKRFDEQQAARQKMLQDVAKENDYELVEEKEYDRLTGYDKDLYEAPDLNQPQIYDAQKAKQEQDLYVVPDQAQPAKYDALKAQQNGQGQAVDEFGYGPDDNTYDTIADEDYDTIAEEEPEQDVQYTRAVQEKGRTSNVKDKEDEGQGQDEEIYDDYYALEAAAQAKYQQQQQQQTVGYTEPRQEDKTQESAYNNGPEDEGIEEDDKQQEEQSGQKQEQSGQQEEQSGQKAWLNNIIKAGPKAKQGSFSKGKEAEANLSHAEKALAREEESKGIVNDGH